MSMTNLDCKNVTLMSNFKILRVVGAFAFNRPMLFVVSR